MNDAAISISEKVNIYFFYTRYLPISIDYAGRLNCKLFFFSWDCGDLSVSNTRLVQEQSQRGSPPHLISWKCLKINYLTFKLYSNFKVIHKIYKKKYDIIEYFPFLFIKHPPAHHHHPPQNYFPAFTPDFYKYL